jgi:hypothetical protein
MNRRISWYVVAIFALFLGCGGKNEEARRAGGDEATQSEMGAAGEAGSTTHAYGRSILQGMVKVVGDVPQPTVLTMSADSYCQEAHAGEKVLSEDVVVDTDGMVANAFVYVREGLEGRHYEPSAEPVVLNQVGCMYQPHVLGMMAGQPLNLVSSDPTLHNIHALPTVKGNKEFNVGMSRPDVEITKTFTKPEIMVHMKCDVHPWMSAYIGVVGHPFFAVTDGDGRFEIPRLPAGTYTLEVWHEVFGTQSRQITVDESGTQEVDFTFDATS